MCSKYKSLLIETTCVALPLIGYIPYVRNAQQVLMPWLSEILFHTDNTIATFWSVLPDKIRLINEQLATE